MFMQQTSSAHLDKIIVNLATEPLSPLTSTQF